MLIIIARTRLYHRRTTIIIGKNKKPDRARVCACKLTKRVWIPVNSPNYY